jgi:hypothetical protein
VVECRVDIASDEDSGRKNKRRANPKTLVADALRGVWLLVTWPIRIATNEDAKKTRKKVISLAGGSEGLEVADESVSDVLWQSGVARAHFCQYRIHQRHE